MKKLTILIFSLLLISLIFHDFEPQKKLKVLRIVTASKFFVDFNHNNKPDNNELVKVYGVKPFEPEFGRENASKAHSLGSNKAQVAALGAETNNYAKSLLQNKFVTLKFIDNETKTPNHFSTAIVYLNGKDYGKTLLERGFAIADFKNDFGYKNNENIKAIDKNIKLVKTDNFFVLNKKNNKYHRLNCKYAQKARDYEILTLENMPKNSEKCHYCLDKYHKKLSPHISPHPDEKIVIKNFDFSQGGIQYYFMDFNKSKKPSNNCSTNVCKALLYGIKNAQNSIDFAVYGISDEPAIINALTNAQKRGVRIRWVTDSDSKGNNIYKDVAKAKLLLPNWEDDQKTINKKNINSIMHNKFFIFDKKIVWVGSANISDTDLSDFNANIILLIKSPQIAQIYENEFEQMYGGKFHRLKTSVNAKSWVNIEDGSDIKTLFSPYDKIIETELVPLIENSKKYIYISAFVMTQKNLKTALIRAKNRGVDVKIILDATGAGDKYSANKILRQNGVFVKVENKAGKMHSKSMVIDDKYTITGSMNFSRSGEDFNDENVIIIESPSVAGRFREQFLYMYKSISNKWLYKNPRAESFDSIGSCSDGVDNDFDGQVDLADTGCKAYKR